MQMTFEQLQFFFDEVIGELGWNDEIEQSGIDPLAYARSEIKNMQRRNLTKGAPMEQTYLNRKMIVDNTPIITAVLRGDLVGYFNPVCQDVELISPEVVSHSPSVVTGMTPTTFNQTAQYKGWTAEEISIARKQNGETQ